MVSNYTGHQWWHKMQYVSGAFPLLSPNIKFLNFSRLCVHFIQFHANKFQQTTGTAILSKILCAGFCVKKIYDRSLAFLSIKKLTFFQNGHSLTGKGLFQVLGLSPVFVTTLSVCVYFLFSTESRKLTEGRLQVSKLKKLLTCLKCWKSARVGLGFHLCGCLIISKDCALHLISGDLHKNKSAWSFCMKRSDNGVGVRKINCRWQRKKWCCTNLQNKQTYFLGKQHKLNHKKMTVGSAVCTAKRKDGIGGLQVRVQSCSFLAACCVSVSVEVLFVMKIVCQFLKFFAEK